MNVRDLRRLTKRRPDGGPARTRRQGGADSASLASRKIRKHGFRLHARSSTCGREPLDSEVRRKESSVPRPIPLNRVENCGRAPLARAWELHRFPGQRESVTMTGACRAVLRGSSALPSSRGNRDLRPCGRTAPCAGEPARHQFPHRSSPESVHPGTQLQSLDLDPDVWKNSPCPSRPCGDGASAWPSPLHLLQSLAVEASSSFRRSARPAMVRPAPSRISGLGSPCPISASRSITRLGVKKV